LEKFGERIRELRKERGITSYEMATRLGISRNTLTNWERGNKEPHAVEILEEMAKIFEVPLKYLLLEKRNNNIEKNPVIKDLLERVSRLEKILK
jgi:transcriptional regulator with XRE-family HTH domain